MTKLCPTKNPCTPLKRREKELVALQDIARAITRYSGQQKILHEVLRILEDRLWFRRTTIMLLSPDGRELVVDAIHPRAITSSGEKKYSRGEGVTGDVLRTGQPAVIPRIAEEPRFRGHIHQRSADEHDYSFICMPVILGKEVVGTLSADTPGNGPEFLNACQRTLGLVASLIAGDLKARRRAKQEHMVLEEENVRLRDELKGRYRPENIIGNSQPMRDVYGRIHQVAPTSTTVLIRGASGTGKELVASAVHYTSPRAKNPLVRVNCAALNENLLESELFGHEKGAFTGAVNARLGRIEQAEGGTLFLDEIGDFSPVTQVKLLRVVQEREYERVGGNETRKADVRIIAATNRDLEQAVESGEFRQDLYYRINVFPLVLPALHERKDDILLLADHFVSKYAESMGKTVRRISTNAINMMLAYHWPGNVRELENCIEHAVLLCDSDVVQGYMLPPTLQMPEERSVPVGSLKARMELLEKDMLIDSLKRHQGNCAAAARELGITARMVRYKVQNLKLENYATRRHHT